jgi:hypothetical protein
MLLSLRKEDGAHYMNGGIIEPTLKKAEELLNKTFGIVPSWKQGLPYSSGLNTLVLYHSPKVTLGRLSLERCLLEKEREQILTKRVKLLLEEDPSLM